MTQPYDPFAKLDLGGFENPDPKAVDRDAAEAGRAAGEEAGFTSRRTPARPRAGRGGAAKAQPKSAKVRLSD
ncbi:hypothetical protein K6U59_12210, partial [Vibrio vulnificus]|uniref:hypothetical protein n=1 Tax=Vibrio vulnificus TaxID=672 RepID=UPI001EE9E43A